MGIPTGTITAVQGGMILTESQGKFLNKMILEVEGMEQTKNIARRVLESGYYNDSARRLLNMLRELYIDELRNK